MTWSLLFLAITVLLMGFMTTPVHGNDDVEAVEDVEEDDVEVFDEEDEAEEEEEEEEDEDEEEDDDDEFGDEHASSSFGHPDVESSYLFPKYPDNKIKLGQEATLVVVLSNAGSETFNLTDVRAHLHSAYDFTYYIQNYTGKDPNAVLYPNTEVSLEYTFVPDKTLETLEYWMSAYVTYNDTNNRVFRSTFTNTTIELIEGDSVFTVNQFFTYFLVAAGIGLVGYVATSFNSQSPARKSAERGTGKASSGSGDGWGEVYTQSKASRTVRKRSRKQH